MGDDLERWIVTRDPEQLAKLRAKADELDSFRSPLPSAARTTVAPAKPRKVRVLFERGPLSYPYETVSFSLVVVKVGMGGYPGPTPFP